MAEGQRLGFNDDNTGSGGGGDMRQRGDGGCHGKGMLGQDLGLFGPDLGLAGLSRCIHPDTYLQGGGSSLGAAARRRS
jgi:hypothetical protein